MRSAHGTAGPLTPAEHDAFPFGRRDRSADAQSCVASSVPLMMRARSSDWGGGEGVACFCPSAGLTARVRSGGRGVSRGALPRRRDYTGPGPLGRRGPIGSILCPNSRRRASWVPLKSVPFAPVWPVLLALPSPQHNSGAQHTYKGLVPRSWTTRGLAAVTRTLTPGAAANPAASAAGPLEAPTCPGLTHLIWIRLVLLQWV